MSRHFQPYEIDEISLRHINQTLTSFIDAWFHSTLVETGIKPDIKGSVQNIYALDYCVYENVYALVTPAHKSFVNIASHVFGQCLVNILKFDWCFIESNAGKTLALFHPVNGRIIPLESMIIYQLSSDPQFDKFQYLFFTILNDTIFWQTGYHPLADTLRIDDDEFEQHYGFIIPKDIKQQFAYLSNYDFSELIRTIGFDIYDYDTTPNWDSIRSTLKSIEYGYKALFGKDWKNELDMQSQSAKIQHEKELAELKNKLKNRKLP